MNNTDIVVEKDFSGHVYTTIWHAKEHNLKNITVQFPRNKLVVITGVSGSGKSSLAFDTLYAEGQRRYMAGLPAYARQIIGILERPQVDKIEGLSPVIAIEQKTTATNPRSTVGTTTEIYDFLRLLFARASEAYSYLSGRKMVKKSIEQIQYHLVENFFDQYVILLAPVIRGRKGIYKDLFAKIRKMGFVKVRVDGIIREVTETIKLDQYQKHDIEIVIDRLIVKKGDERLKKALDLAMKHGEGVAMLQDMKGTIHFFSKLMMDTVTGLSYAIPEPNIFSFNSPYGACPTCEGLATIQHVDMQAIIPDETLSIAEGGILSLGSYNPSNFIYKKIIALFKIYDTLITSPINQLSDALRKALLYGSDKILTIQDSQHVHQISHTTFSGIIPILKSKIKFSNNLNQPVGAVYTKICPDCCGARLKKESLHFKIDQKNIVELANMDMQQLHVWLTNLEDRLSSVQKVIAKELLKEIRKRVMALLDVGLHYLSLDRSIQTLSGGEAQRIRLASQIGTQLMGVMYILDEPSIGLHQRDNHKLIAALKKLRDLGNTVVVVEHDRDMMMEADYIIDMGPGAGVHGGEVIAYGTPHQIIQQKSYTADFLRNYAIPTVPKRTCTAVEEKYIILRGCKGNNLKNVTLQLPLNKLVCITGVSGSGKSTLIHETLYPIVSKHCYRTNIQPMPFESITGLNHIDKVIEINQKPIGRTPRSNPATYTGVLTDIRNIFTLLPEAKIRGYKIGQFSFNVKGGRCEICQGGGMKLIEMDFLPDVHILCEGCQGKRYNRATLSVRYQGKSIADILEMTVEKALSFFEKYPKILKKLATLQQVGLGYLQLGQHSTTLSGGEAQRVKLATELSKKDTGKTLYIFDEPTTGLHFQDIQQLLHIVHQLVEKGNTVIIIEHNMDIIKTADHIIDLGLEGGKNGGEILCTGTPEEIAIHPTSYTGLFLKKELAL